jgi:hypothetical protein
MKDFKVTPRNAGGWNGAHGTAYTVTAELASGKRGTIRRIGVGDKMILTHGTTDRLVMDFREFSKLFDEKLAEALGGSAK